ncbi:MAG: T9SS type A sorting domain-containing protein [Bacteroidetes bacterium]|nr:T9SS type A sorting domain-containing protein [Bacteroidota bacterium]
MNGAVMEIYNMQGAVVFSSWSNAAVYGFELPSGLYVIKCHKPKGIQNF